MQGTMHQFAKSVGLATDDPDPAAAAPTTPEPVKTPTSTAAQKLQTRGQQIDKAVDDASK